ncbi:PilZ domain-containing protein [Paenibacillus sp. CN-4]|uniref:PilZ domain-containing protein n=1 Tax=Paenibacillus nanchangensis TaxID=3348343 RepID=UPI0039797D93
METPNRKEPFRYVMNQPIDCKIEVPVENGGPGAGKTTEGILLDLSRSGCKIRTPLNLRFTTKETRIKVYFQLNDRELEFDGCVRWGWMFGIGLYQYGIRLDLTPAEDELLLHELEFFTLSAGEEAAN